MTPAEILAAIPKLAALVVGDICLDRWCTYDQSTNEASRETGILCGDRHAALPALRRAMLRRI
jgi:hypothetical protein